MTTEQIENARKEFEEALKMGRKIMEQPSSGKALDMPQLLIAGALVSMRMNSWMHTWATLYEQECKHKKEMEILVDQRNQGKELPSQ